MFIQQLRL